MVKKVTKLPVKPRHHSDQVSHLSGIAWEHYLLRQEVQRQLAVLNDLVGFSSNALDTFVGDVFQHAFVLGVIAAENPVAVEKKFQEQIEKTKAEIEQSALNATNKNYWEI